MTPMERLREIAELKARIPNYKQLAAETGWTEGYCRQIVAIMVGEIRKRTNVQTDVSGKPVSTSRQ